ncbi:MAG: Gfo/Idh/MocA family oxidoreductase [Paenibacillus dendritiformis]|uniref:Gfo/Idh/MocA family protein n=1 Tax=uncultured Paenibacillus sp. TaxID=227322 RepID=UPI0025E31290|nr:Gfo/Idh/MocA family oxidoreductase [uncultured Paenibacillus sp.]MDU5144528.1 Gfo/Idh/MocA family oxidoreductase [Paenibacillus dendritiformis]
MKKVKLALIGAGLRGVNYTNYALEHPVEAEVVAVAEPVEERRMSFQQAHRLPDEMCFADWREMMNRPKLADAVLICTQDYMHYGPTMRALECGYHVLLEKPMSPKPLECIRMGERARQAGLVFSICHVLRYTRFFGTIKQMLEEGRIGRLMSIQHNENVGYWHQAHSFVRGNWRNADETSPMILAKSCHDMDILLWLAGESCTNVASFGRLSHFKAENAPAGAPKRCLDGCPAAEDCLYYAPKTYLTDEDNWMKLAISDDQSYEGRLKAIQEGPYGRCVYHCDNNVVDHQVVSMDFRNEVTAVFTMSAFTKECSRTIKLMGTEGEIRGAMEKNEIELIRFDRNEPEPIFLGAPGGHAGHGGGDEGLIRDFIRLVANGGALQGLTSAENSVQSHMMAFAAEEARVTGKVVHLPEYLERFASATI